MRNLSVSEVMSLQDDYTVMICSYKATKEFELCLFLLAMHRIKNLFIIENSPKEYLENRNLLKECNIKYIDNPGGTHPEAIDMHLKEVKTRYCLLLDSDCFCLKNPAFSIDYAMYNNIQLYGDVCGSRGGCLLKKRVHPWYCVVDVDFLKKNNISFLDWKRIKETESEMFYTSCPDKNIDKMKFHYDVGSTMCEDVYKANGLVCDMGDENIKEMYLHIEGSSWRNESNIAKFKEAYAKKYEQFMKFYNRFNVSREIIKERLGEHS